ncbi:MAG: hypothetical protein M1372_00775 [Patescibacteria group bacterium]|nr:hypothetical protein [Patescibacteria group bacterium]
MRPIEVEHYPFKIGEDECVIDSAISNQMKELFSNSMFSDHLREELPKRLYVHYLRARFMFWDEEALRSKGFPNANLYYHGKEHAVFQTTYDAATIMRALLSRGDRLSSHLTQEGVVATIIAAMYHDTGFVYQKQPLANFARMSPVHVEESKRAAVESLEALRLSSELDMEKLKKLVVIGIHGTYFPYDEEATDEGRKLIDSLPLEDRKEAQIVRLAVQFADLGGQTARIDNYPDGLLRLREEMNACRQGLGDRVIGESPDEVEKKRKEFIKFVVDKTVGKTGNAFLGTNDHSFSREWRKTSASSR